MIDMPFGLERSQDGQHGRVREIVSKLVADLRDRCGATVPENGHDVQLAIGEKGHQGERQPWVGAGAVRAELGI
jgi:hypothetical protein